MTVTLGYPTKTGVSKYSVDNLSLSGALNLISSLYKGFSLIILNFVSYKSGYASIKLSLIFKPIWDGTV